MYLGMLLILAGWALVVSNLAALVMLPLFVLYLNRFQIGPEERALQARFGAEFEDYCRKVRRWL
jgi:protein-S-isoprenylcysteine O-methyltransferase Ste14